MGYNTPSGKRDCYTLFLHGDMSDYRNYPLWPGRNWVASTKIQARQKFSKFDLCKLPWIMFMSLGY